MPYGCADLVASHQVERDSKQCKEIRGRMEAVRKLRKRVGRHVDQYLRMREGKKGSLGSEASDLAPEDDDDDEAVHQLEHEEDMLGNTIRELYEQESNFINRLLVHSLTLLLSNSTRDILLKYHFSSRSRKGFMYHVSQLNSRITQSLTWCTSAFAAATEVHQ